MMEEGRFDELGIDHPNATNFTNATDTSDGIAEAIGVGAEL